MKLSNASITDDLKWSQISYDEKIAHVSYQLETVYPFEDVKNSI